jgi:hypothetical protein
MFLGMRGTGDWVTNQRPENWRQTILKLYPNGDAPLTAILAMMASESTDDPHFHWWTELFGNVAGSVTGVFTDAGCGTAYVNGAASGAVLYLKVADALFTGVVPGHQLLLRDQSNLDVDVNAKVLEKFSLGTDYIIAVKLLEADDNGGANDLSDCDYAMVIGNINPEGGEMPVAVANDPTEYSNYTQIFRTALDITRTAQKTKLRTGDAYQKAKVDTLERHSVEMELAFLWGIRTLGIGANGKPERTTMGLINYLRTYAAANNSNYVADAGYAGQNWITGGEDWLNEKLEVIFRYGSSEKLCFAGSGALLGLNRLAKAGAQITLTPQTKAYGIDVHQWITPFGTLNVKTHPLFSYDVTTRNMIVIFEPKNIKYRYIDDTTFYPEGEKQNTGRGRVDGKSEEYLTEAGLEFHHPQTGGLLTGFNSTNTVAE